MLVSNTAEPTPLLNDTPPIDTNISYSEKFLFDYRYRLIIIMVVLTIIYSLFIVGICFSEFPLLIKIIFITLTLLLALYPYMFSSTALKITFDNVNRTITFQKITLIQIFKNSKIYCINDIQNIYTERENANRGKITINIIVLTKSQEKQDLSYLSIINQLITQI